ncbi:hypothetical protein EE612_037523 [Oryza sativa]|nr:hypothetical protein EE612_037523 [Oryza sativa]
MPLPSCRRREQRPRQSCFQNPECHLRLRARQQRPQESAVQSTLSSSIYFSDHFVLTPPPFQITATSIQNSTWLPIPTSPAVAAPPLPRCLGGVDGEGAPCAPPPSPIPAGPASSTVSAASSAPATRDYLGGITGHRLGQEDDSGGHEYTSVSGIHVPSSSGVAFVSFGQCPQEVISTDLCLGLGPIAATAPLQPPPPPAAAAAAGSPSATTPEPGHGEATPTTSSSAQFQTQAQQVTRDMWMACAAPKSGRLPTVGSLVYYFPDGHAEQCLSRPQEPLPGRIFLCKVTDVRLGAAATNEALATISLVPIAADDHAFQLQAPADPDPAPAQSQSLVSFVKPLTYTDVTKNRFMVPKDDAAAGVLPHIQLNDDVPLRIKDLSGKEWAFNYTWKAHTRMFRNGWMEFSNANGLVTGDNAVFMRRGNGEMFMAVRRTRNRPAPFSVEEVIEAVWRAARREPFEVSYCLRQDGDEFVVPRDIVDDGLRARFAPGMAVNFVWAVEDGKLPTIGPQGEVISIENYATSIGA